MRRVHRAAARAASIIGAPTNATEVRLEQVQMDLTAAQREVERLTGERDALALHLWLDHRSPQAEIAARLDRADRDAGGEGISYAAVQKRLFRIREDALSTAG